MVKFCGDLHRDIASAALTTVNLFKLHADLSELEAEMNTALQNE